jgi:heme exporter protein D|tara:strand:+ start:90 stop:263 length:174 start_codon:yes stop_codon:yes gene_type:complete
MTLAETLTYLPYGKYAFYIWLSYGVTFLVIAELFVRTSRNHKKVLVVLTNKYAREDD